MTTIGMLLQEDLAAISERAAGVLRNSRAVATLPPFTRDALRGQVQASLDKLHDITIGDVLKLAWGTSRNLNKAAHESLATGRRQSVRIEGYAIPVDYTPKLEVIIDGRRIATLELSLRLHLEVLRLDGVVELGRLMRVSSDVFEVTGAVSAQGHTLAQRKAQLDLKLEMPLPATGLPLVRGA